MLSIKKALPLAALAAAALLAAGCGNKGAKGQIKIGLSMDTLQTERWQHDRDAFTKRCAELGAKVLVQVANSNDALQNSQADNLLTQGVSVLVVIPHNGKTAATIVDAAHKANVPVLAYDRMIMDSDLDMYVSIDPVGVGRLQAEYLVKRRPKGRYVLIEGAPTDNNAVLLRQGQMEVLKPYVDRGDIKIVGEQWAKDWQPVEALKIMENILTRVGNKVDAVLASNDGTAGGAIQALGEQKLAGKVLVTGQDADLAACQRIVEGTQDMTIYKSLTAEAYKAAEVAVAMAKKEPLPGNPSMIPNGKRDVPSILLLPMAVDKANLNETVIADGFQKMEEVYKNVPKDKWPAAKK
ncbi:MAG: D-xylose ABC transporter substrate-binding protein [candidate division FCPU426 bacterium]